MKKKSLLLISSHHDQVTEKIYSYINKLSKCEIDQTRINFEDGLTLNTFDFFGDDCTVTCNEQVLNIKDYDFIIFRRGRFNFNYQKNIDLHPFTKYFENELSSINNYLFTFFKSKMLSNYFDEKVSKLTMLESANHHGIAIPKTIITNSKKILSAFFEKCKGKVITKAIQNAGIKVTSNLYAGAGTIEVNRQTIKNLTDQFFPSLFQEMILKDFEIRTFFLDGSFYSMAIFSQGNKKTRVDFRNYDRDHPNRTVPYQLPKNIESSLKKLFRDLHLTTGSVDFIKGVDGEYYFLEVNPVGQFSQVSTPTNYQLEKKMAIYAIEKINNN